MLNTEPEQACFTNFVTHHVPVTDMAVVTSCGTGGGADVPAGHHNGVVLSQTWPT
jgi:hypothetical protein